MPKVPVGRFDLVTCIDDLRVPLAGLRVAVGRVEQLSWLMHVGWVLFGTAWDLMSDEFTAVGAHALQEHPDVANELVGTVFAAAKPDPPAAAC
jgi:hypothetical protein